MADRAIRTRKNQTSLHWWIAWLLVSTCCWTPLTALAYDSDAPPDRASPWTGHGVLNDVPNMRGQGAVKELAKAAAASPKLAALLRQYIRIERRGAQAAALDELLAAWSATSGDVPSTVRLVVVAGRGGKAIFVQGKPNSEAERTLQETVRRIEVLESFTGNRFFSVVSTAAQSDGGQDLTYKAGAIQHKVRLSPAADGTLQLQDTQLVLSATQQRFINQAYRALTASLYRGTLLKGCLAPYVNKVEGSGWLHMGAADLAPMLEEFHAVAAAQPVKALGDLQDLFEYAPAELTDDPALKQLHDELAGSVPINYPQAYAEDFGPAVQDVISLPD